jgi:TolB-like protein
VIQSSKGVFLSYASEDEDVAKRICDALRMAGTEVWFDQSELRGGDAWDQKIRQQILDCALFVPIISAHTQARPEGYFRLEWKLAVDRSQLMAMEKAFLVPVVVDATTEPGALVPAQFREVQWTRIQPGEVPAAFVERIATLLSQPVAHRLGSPERGVNRAPAGRWPIVLIAGSIAVVFALVVATAMRGEWLWHTRVPKVAVGIAPVPLAATPATIPEKSIAVLPFVDMSEKKDQEYFSDGLSEELIDALTKIPDLRVPARTSSFYFKGKQTTIADIAKLLGVAHILEGSVRKSGNTLRVTAQLIRADSGYHLWSATYDRPQGNIFKVQDEIASALVKELKVSILQGSSIVQSGTKDIDAYTSFLQARAVYRAADTRETYDRAASYAEQAIKQDPTFASAWTLLASIVTTQVAAGLIPGKEGIERARHAVQKALDINPRLAEAHAALAQIHLIFDWDWPSGEAQVREALNSDRENPAAMTEAAYVALLRGRSAEAIEWQRKVVAKDPVSAHAHYALGHAYLRAGNLDAAYKEARAAIDLEPGISEYRGFLAGLLVEQGKPAAALAELRRVSDEGIRVAGLAVVYRAMKRNAEADRALAQFEGEFGRADAYTLASIHAYRLEFDQAFAALDRAYENRESALPWIKTDPDLKNLWSDPRFAAFLQRMNL